MSTIDQLCVLYVDHDNDSCEMLVSLLGFYEIQVKCAGSVKEALFLARTSAVDLYLLASRFTDGDGIGLCRVLRGRSPQTPIVFYSGDARETDKQAGFLAGADEYLTKPDSDKIIATILKLTKHGNIPQSDARRAADPSPTGGRC